MPSPTATTRLSRPERRDALLDAAAAILVDLGRDGLTMERLADVAGVSKALPYRHFDNADQVLVELSRREIVLLGEHVAAVRSQIDDPHERLRGTVATFFDVVSERPGLSQVFAAIVGSTWTARPVGAEETQRFLRLILVEDVDLDPNLADAAATVFEAALLGATAAWLRGQASRGRSVRTVVAVAEALATSAGVDGDDD